MAQEIAEMVAIRHKRIQCSNTQEKLSLMSLGEKNWSLNYVQCPVSYIMSQSENEGLTAILNALFNTQVLIPFNTD